MTSQKQTTAAEEETIPQSRNTNNQSLSTSLPGELAPLQLTKRMVSTVIDCNLYQINPTIDRPADNVWVVRAGDPLLIKYVINAVVHGVILLITSTDKEAIPSELSSLLHKTYIQNDDEYTVKIKEWTYPVHPEFKLYLSCSTPIHLTGGDSKPLLYAHSNMIDLSLSQQSRINELLTSILKVEKPDFSAQSRSLDAGILHHKRELDHEHSLLQSRVSSLSAAILDDEEMLDYLKTTYTNIVRNSQILDETVSLKQQLFELKESYLPVALHAAMMFDVYEHMSILSPYYYMEFHKFHSICAEIIQSRFRGKGVIGAPKARCQELVNAVTDSFLRVVKTSMFEKDYVVFTVLVCIQRLASQSIPGDEIQTFIQNTINKRRKTSHDKPVWMKYESWLACHQLEEDLPCFSGLCESLLKHSSSWKEYFYNKMSVVSSTPSEQLKLTVFQKCILWKAVLPERLSEVCENLILTELGPSALDNNCFSVKDVFDKSLQSEPLLILEPTTEQQLNNHDNSHTGSTWFDAVNSIKSLVPENQRIMVVTFGSDVLLNDVIRQLRICISTGMWIILNNCHLLKHWSTELIQIIQRILDIRQEEFDSIEAEARNNPVTPYEELNSGINRNFRLFFTCQHSDISNLPSSVILKSQRIINQLRNNYKQVIISNFQLASDKFNSFESQIQDLKVRDKASGVVLPLALLHSQLAHRLYYNGAAFETVPHINVNMLEYIIQKIPHVLTACQSHALPDFITEVYESCCTSKSDQQVVRSIVRTILTAKQTPKHTEPCQTSTEPRRTPTEPHQTSTETVEPNDLNSVLLNNDITTTEKLLQQLNNITLTNAASLNLSNSADFFLQHTNSRNYSRSLLRVSGNLDSLINETRLSFNHVDELLSGWQSVLLTLPELPKTSSNQMCPLDNFYHDQVQSYRELIKTLNQDAELLRGVTKGEIACNEKALAMINQLKLGQVPSRWRDQIPGSSHSLMKWKSDLEKSLELLVQYTDPNTRPLIINLSVFTNPRKLLNAVSIKYSRSTYEDVNDLKLTAQFLPMGYNPSTPACSGVYVSGLSIHNARWSTSDSIIVRCTDVETINTVPVLHIQVVNKSVIEADDAFLCPLMIKSEQQHTLSQYTILNVSVKTKNEKHRHELIEKHVHLTSRLPC